MTELRNWNGPFLFDPEATLKLFTKHSLRKSERIWWSAIYSGRNLMATLEGVRRESVWYIKWFLLLKLSQAQDVTFSWLKLKASEFHYDSTRGNVLAGTAIIRWPFGEDYPFLWRRIIVGVKNENTVRIICARPECGVPVEAWGLPSKYSCFEEFVFR
jgi:hypothetical protein